MTALSGITPIELTAIRIVLVSRRGFPRQIRSAWYYESESQS